MITFLWICLAAYIVLLPAFLIFIICLCKAAGREVPEIVRVGEQSPYVDRDELVSLLRHRMHDFPDEAMTYLDAINLVGMTPGPGRDAAAESFDAQLLDEERRGFYYYGHAARKEKS